MKNMILAITLALGLIVGTTTAQAAACCGADAPCCPGECC